MLLRSTRTFRRQPELADRRARTMEGTLTWIRNRRLRCCHRIPTTTSRR